MSAMGRCPKSESGGLGTITETWIARFLVIEILGLGTILQFLTNLVPNERLGISFPSRLFIRVTTAPEDPLRVRKG